MRLKGSPATARRPNSGGATSTIRRSTGWSPKRKRQNIDVRTAGLRILEARAELGIAGSTLYPQLQQLSGEVLRAGQQQSNGPDSAVWRYRVGLDIAWELDFWGKFRRGIESADAAYFASIASYDDVQVLVAAQAASFYATIRTIEQRLRIAHENAALQKRSLEITERLFKSGNESELDVQQARTQYLSTVASIPELEGSLRQVQNALNVLLARPPGPAARDGGGTREDSDGRARSHRRPARRPAAPPTGRACGRDASRRAVGSDWRQ